jgi:CCR4-NOT transcription complex subunit 10
MASLPKASSSGTGTGFYTAFSETEKTACKQATNYFKAKNYSGAAEVYKQLLTERQPAPDTYRLEHNVIVCNFLKNNCVDVDGYYKDLKRIVEKVEAENLSWNKLDPVLQYNVAVLLFHHKQYDNAFQTIQKLRDDLEDTTNLFTARVQLLLIDIYLRWQEFELMLIEIDKFEMMYKSPVSKLFDSLSDAEIYLQREAEHEVLERLKEMKVFYFLGLNLLTAAKRESKALVSFNNDTKQSILISTHFKARHEFLRGNCDKAGQLLCNLKEMHTNTFWSTGDNLDLILENNLGCVRYAMGKPNVGCNHFVNASRVCDEPEYKDKQKQPLYCRAYNKKYEIVYNLGVALLQQNQPPQQAYLYLSSCRKAFFDNARLWLHIAECCVKIYLQGQERVWAEENKQILQMLRENLGTCTVPPLFQRRQSEIEIPELAQNIPQPTLTYASECVAIALKIMDPAKRVIDCPTFVLGPSQPLTTLDEISILEATILRLGAYISCLLHQYKLTISYCTRIIQMTNLPIRFKFFATMYLGEALFKMPKGEEACMNLAKDSQSRKPGTSQRAFVRALDENDKCQLSSSQINLSDNCDVDSAIAYNQGIVLLNSGNLEAARVHLETSIVKMSPRTPPAELIILLTDVYTKQGNLEEARTISQKFMA